MSYKILISGIIILAQTVRMIPFSVYLVFFFWLLGFYFLWKIPGLESGQGQHVTPSHLSVIIPARNEAKALGTLLNSLKTQNIQCLEIIVVDDHSEDRTSDIASRADCIVLNSEPLPEGWAGKPWACWQGAMRSKGQLLLFLDADTRLHPDAVEKLLAAFQKKKGLISVQPYHHMETWRERLAAFFNIITLAGMNVFTILGNRLRPIGAFGPCNLCSKKDYVHVGGHETVRGEILESLGLGKAFLHAGLPVNCYGGKGAVSFRMYPEGFRSLFEGFSKGFGIGAKATTIAGQVLIFCWIYGGMHLTRHWIQSAVQGNISELIIFSILDLFYIFQVYCMLRRIGNFHFITACLFQIPLIFFVIVFCHSLFATFMLRKATWRGRTVPTKTG